jgi:hypothetical protein
MQELSLLSNQGITKGVKGGNCVSSPLRKKFFSSGMKGGDKHIIGWPKLGKMAYM